MDYTAPDPLLDFIDRTMEKVLAALVPGTWLVDAVPICMYSIPHIYWGVIMTEYSATRSRVVPRRRLSTSRASTLAGSPGYGRCALQICARADQDAQL